MKLVFAQSIGGSTSAVAWASASSLPSVLKFCKKIHVERREEAACVIQRDTIAQQCNERQCTHIHTLPELLCSTYIQALLQIPHNNDGDVQKYLVVIIKNRMPNASEEWGQLNTDANVMVVIVVVIMVVLMAEVNDGGEL